MKHRSPSVGARTVLTTGIMLVPMLLMAVVGTAYFKEVADAVSEAEEEVRYELMPVIELQTLLLKAVMPPNDYLIHGNTDERRIFTLLKEQIDKKFNAIEEQKFGEENEREALRLARTQWVMARVVGQEIVDEVYPPKEPRVAAEKMERFDRMIDDANIHLEMLYKHIVDELGEHVEDVEASKAKARMSTLIAFVAAIVVAVIGGLVLARTILNPIRALDEGVSRLREGQLSHRFSLPSDDELGHLGETLNEMATKIERLATRDDLTGLYVKREFNRFLNEEISRSARSGRPFALLLIDADRFKDINDRHGHPVGDRVLSTLALVLTHDMRAIDRVARIGGEEFAVIMPDTREGPATDTAERIRRMAESKKVRTSDGENVSITISVGIAIYPDDGRTSEALVDAADHALYAAKAGGRNCVRKAQNSQATLEKPVKNTA